MFKRPKSKTANRDALRPGHRFEGEVRDLSSDGQGVVAHPNGRVFFVPGVWRGEQGQFEVSSLKGRMGFARLIELNEESSQRRSSPCPHHGVTNDSCGGCPWLFVNYAEQLQSKTQLVRKVLQSLKENLVINNIWASPDELGYRNRAQLKSDGNRLGYVAGSSREIVDVVDCLVLNTKNRETLGDLRSKLPQRAWKPRRGKPWSTIDIDDDIDANQAELNQRRPFRQGNSAQNERMRQWLKERVAALGSSEPVVELFAGSGNFTDVLVDAGCGGICAVDSFRPAVDSLRDRSLPEVSAQCIDLDRAGSASALEQQLEEARLLVMDPPREGLKNIGDYLSLAKKLQTIIYVSCNPATLARDLKEALNHGFALNEVQPLDLFPQTPHVEVLTVLTR